MGWLSNRCVACFHLMPLIKKIILTFAVLLSAISKAHSAPASVKWLYNGVTHTTTSSYCSSYVAHQNAQNNYVVYTLISHSFQAPLDVVCTIEQKVGTNPPTTLTMNYTGEYFCSTGALIGTTNPPTCPEPPNPCKDKKGQPVTWFSTSATGADQCIDLCTAKMRSGDCGGNPPDMRCWYSGEYTGDQCNGTGQNPNPNPTPTPEPKPNPCPECDCLKSGQGYGTVNGTVVCTPKGSVGSKPTTSIKEGTTSTTTPAPTPENPNPTPVTVQAPPVIVTTTPAPAGSPAGTEPTISSSTTNPDGSTTDKTESKENFCKDNPTSKLCKAQTACEESPEGPTCKHFCDKFPDSVACTEAIDFIGDPSNIPPEDTLQEKEIAAPTGFSRISVPSANGCPPPLTMSLYGAPIVMSFQWLCDYASAFKPLMIAFALMFAATVVMGGVRSDSQPYQRGLF